LENGLYNPLEDGQKQKDNFLGIDHSAQHARRLPFGLWLPDGKRKWGKSILDEHLSSGAKISVHFF